MYIPAHFAEARVPVLQELIRRHPLATLVTVGPDGIEADHIPLEIDPEPAPFGTLRGHVSRSNPLWRETSAGADCLAIFTGPDVYVTPAWYPAKTETGRVVPTWNYAVVHARGPLRIIHDAEWLRALVTRLTDAQEAGRRDPWRVTDAPADFIERQLGGIVGIEIAIRRLQGKWKVSQNRTPEDRAGVVAALRERGDAGARVMADLVEGGGPRQEA